MDSKPVYRKLTMEYLSELIKKNEPEVEIESMNEETAAGRGDNYTSMLYRIRLNGKRRLKSDDYEPWDTAIIYKILPESRARRDLYKSELLFRNEMAFYNNVWPEFQKLQINGKQVFNGVAKVYIAEKDIIAMEDLKKQGYIMADRRMGLGVERLKIVLKALARFHALSLTLKDLRPETFDRLSDESNPDSIRETLFRRENVDWYRQYYRVAFKNAITMVSEALPPEYESRRDEIIGKFEAFLQENDFFFRMCELASSRGPLTVFCHGDCWTNNFLFADQTREDSEPVYLVDFQLTRVGSLALDLAYLLYCCTTRDVRKAHMTSLLQHYHLNLMAALNTLNPNQKTRESSAMWDLLNEEMGRCAYFGFGSALDILPISTCESNHAPDVYEEACEGNGEDQIIGTPPPGGRECPKLMTDLVLEFIEKSLL